MVDRIDRATHDAIGAADQAREMIQNLLARRAAEGSICPSEVARALTAAGSGSPGTNWRNAMPAVHAAVDQLVAEGTVRLSWQGKPLPMRAGPYRITRVR